MSNFKKLDLPRLREYYTKYPQGYTIYESLLDILEHINEITDSVNLTLNQWKQIETWVLDELKNYSMDQLQSWLDDGTLVEVVNEAITHIHQLSKSILQFPRLEGETDDSARFERALNSGYNIVLEKNGVYEINQTLLYTNNVTIYGNNSTINAKSDSSILFLIGRDELNNPVDVENIHITGLNFKGVQTTWEGDKGSAGIHVAGHLYERNGGCKNIHIEHCTFTKLTVGIMADGVTGLTINNIYTTNLYFNNLNATGGYGILLHTCFDVVIKENKFVGVEGDRHAIYVSNAVGIIAPPNENIFIRDNIINFDGVLDITGFESCVSVRSAKGLTIDNNTMTGGYGAIQLIPSAGDTTDVIITNNKATNCRSKLPEYRGIISLYNPDGYKIERCTIENNVLEGVHQNVSAIELRGSKDVTIDSNIVTVKGSQSRGVSIISVDGITIVDNKFYTTDSTYGIDYGGINNDIIIGLNTFKGFTLNETASGEAGNIIHNYPRSAIVTSDGAGSVTLTQPEGDPILTSHANITSGIQLNFRTICNIQLGDVHVTSLTNEFYNFSTFTGAPTNSYYLAIRDLTGERQQISTTAISFMITLLR